MLESGQITRYIHWKKYLCSRFLSRLQNCWRTHGVKLDDMNVTKFLKFVLKYFPKCLYTVGSTQTSRCSLYKKLLISSLCCREHVFIRRQSDCTEPAWCIPEPSETYARSISNPFGLDHGACRMRSYRKMTAPLTSYYRKYQGVFLATVGSGLYTNSLFVSYKDTGITCWKSIMLLVISALFQRIPN